MSIINYFRIQFTFTVYKKINTRVLITLVLTVFYLAILYLF